MKDPNTAFSKQGEALAKQWLDKQGWKCYDISNIETTWKADMDLIAVKGEEPRIVEVKYDSRIAETGNMFIEILTDKENNVDGWIRNTASNYIMYGDAVKSIFYIMRTTDILDYIQRYKGKYQIKEARERNNSKISVGALIPIDEYEKHYWTQKTEPIYNF